MKLFISLSLVVGVVFGTLAQKEMSAKEIFAAIDKKQLVQYDGITITGDLDLTELSNRKAKNNNRTWQEYKSWVEVPLIFRNCTFRGDVIAYKNLEDHGGRKRILGMDVSEGSTTYSTDFTEAVIFENCIFEQAAEFKYSNFAKNANFASCKFKDAANFKYAHFKRDALFADNHFEEYANFKYADFSQEADFRLTRFHDYADFKYAEFNQEATFKQGNFQRHADFKYTDFRKGVNFSDTRFVASSDFKYSKGKGSRRW